MRPPFYYPYYSPTRMSPFFFMPRQFPMQPPIPPIPSVPPVPQVPTGSFNLEQMLQTANSFMTNAQKFTPYFQQATPLFKNLPALYRMYKNFKGVDNAPRDPEPERGPRTERRQVERIDYTPRPSLPKIYQP